MERGAGPGAGAGESGKESTGVGGSGWYEGGAAYWQGVDATLDGVLGGFARLSEPDIAGSRRFLAPFLSGKASRSVSNTRALDCGAGIGRITKQLLAKEFSRVDLVEQNPQFVAAARKLLGGSAAVGEFYTEGLQTFAPAAGTYDVIWVQWVLGHLTDADLVAFFRRCKAGLRPNGIVVVKENVTGPRAVVDEEDHSVTRTEAQLRAAFADAGLKVLKTATQTGFPPDIFPVLMFALE